MPTRNYLFYALTNSVCSKCLVKVEAKIIFRDDCVYLVKHCPTHGREEILIADDIEYYKKSLEFIKPGDMPLKFNTPIKYGCPYDCGLCPDHEQHSCITVVEVTDKCNLSCPICYADSGAEEVSDISQQTRRHRSLEHITMMIDAVVANEGEPQIVQISGGEPTMHPEFFEILDIAKSRPIKHLMINTNGLRIAKDKSFCDRLSQYMPGIEIYLQFDSFEAEALQELRGADLRGVREKAIAHLNEYNISTTLVVTLKKGLNDHEIGKIIEYALQQKCIRGVTFQPIQAAGRLEGFEEKRDRYTLTEVRRSILQQSPHFKPEDILPVPCHPDCLAMAYALKINGKVIPLTGLINPDAFVKMLPNSVLYEQNQELKKQIFELFSTSHSPKSAATSLKQLLCCLPLLAVPEGITYSNVFRVMIVQFLDPYNFDVRSVKRSCIHIVHPDGRIIPFDTFNMFYREGSAGYHLVNNRPD
ncbi:radical SAM protein [Cylindrospermum sp. FACHB-282]|uniref:radical SAM protein n=1 Tax=Cylindrospermum sp. FACHB-282 TaxID=2692794 RepID=UPI0016889247|nr:radical SAM protein [Cylindrospermum sp. FACHB-282]MBD2388788.1 radical SAM protein [Cylindrospermum sp. FACHB-282]